MSRVGGGDGHARRGRGDKGRKALSVDRAMLRPSSVLMDSDPGPSLLSPGQVHVFGPDTMVKPRTPRVCESLRKRSKAGYIVSNRRSHLGKRTATSLALEGSRACLFRDPSSRPCGRQWSCRLAGVLPDGHGACALSSIQAAWEAHQRSPEDTPAVPRLEVPLVPANTPPGTAAVAGRHKTGRGAPGF